MNASKINSTNKSNSININGTIRYAQNGFKNNRIMLIALAFLFVLILGCTKGGAGRDATDLSNDVSYCKTSDDCVQNKCCHPDGAVNKAFALNCENIFCDQSCQGPLDCGAGHIECRNNRCVVVEN